MTLEKNPFHHPGSSLRATIRGHVKAGDVIRDHCSPGCERFTAITIRHPVDTLLHVLGGRKLCEKFLWRDTVKQEPITKFEWQGAQVGVEKESEGGCACSH